MKLNRPDLIILTRFSVRPTDDIWPLHLLDLSDDNHLDVTYKLLKHSPLATKFYLDTFVFPLVLGRLRRNHFAFMKRNASPNTVENLIPVQSQSTTVKRLLRLVKILEAICFSLAV